MNPCFAVLLRDAAPSTWAGCRRVIDAVKDVAPIPITLMVAPRLRGADHSIEFDKRLTERLYEGEELALHGYMHEDEPRPRGPMDALERHWHRGQAEFRSLRCDDALQRLHAGVRWFSANGWPVAGFVAPRWQMGPGTWAALRLTPFEYTLTQDALHALKHDESVPSHSIRFRASNACTRAVSLAWHALPGRLGQDSEVLVRLELSSADADHPKLRRTWQQRIEHHLKYRQPLTLARLVQSWRPMVGCAALGGGWKGMSRPTINA
jgi:predicted deacetylase